MKVYIAGITMGRDLRKLLPKTICNELIKIIPSIVEDAKKALGENAITIIALQEYALTAKPINYALKNELLGKLDEIVRQFENVILIPGSFAVYRELINAPHKINKLNHNYTALNQLHFFNTEGQFSTEYTNYLNKINQPLYENMYMENCAYVLTNRNKIKHKKSFPWHERDGLSSVNRRRSIFYIGDIGVDSPLKEVNVGNKSVNMSILICREHFLDPEIRKLEGKLPLIEVIISDWIEEFDRDNLCGVLNIHMDSKYGLTVYHNTSHAQANRIAEVKAMQYTKNKKHVSDSKKEVPVTLFQHSLTHSKLAHQ